MCCMNQPFFSVIIPTADRPELLKKAVESVTKQSFSDWELIIVDDGKRLRLEGNAPYFQDERIFVYAVALASKGGSRNFGISRARGRYICFLDDDDYYLPDHLYHFWQEYGNEINRDKILRAGYLRLQHEKMKMGPVYRKQRYQHPAKFAVYAFCGVWSLCIPAAYLQENQFNPDLPYWQDTHLLLRLFVKYDLIQLEGYTYVYRIHDHMGSLQAFQRGSLEEVTALNIRAIDDVILHYRGLVGQVLVEADFRYLKAKKYYEAAHYSLVYYDGQAFFHYLIAGLRQQISARFMKSYMILLRDFILKKMGLLARHSKPPE